MTLLLPSYRNRPPRPGEHLLTPIRQLIESVNDTLNGQLNLELHGGRSIDGVGTRIARRLPARKNRPAQRGQLGRYASRAGHALLDRELYLPRA